jgi:hypothetical protein
MTLVYARTGSPEPVPESEFQPIVAMMVQEWERSIKFCIDLNPPLDGLARFVRENGLTQITGRTVPLTEGRFGYMMPQGSSFYQGVSLFSNSHKTSTDLGSLQYTNG